MPKNIWIICLFCISFCQCLIGQSFPEGWIGEYQGTMYIYRTGSEVIDSLDVKFSLQEIHDDMEYTYIMTYDSERYGLIKKDYILRREHESQAYVLDEKDGILIDMSYMDNCFYSSFTVAGSLLNSVMRRTDDGIWFEISTSKEENLRTTKNRTEEEEKAFIVKSYNPFTVQRVMLYEID